MNIFVLDRDPMEAAKMYCDKHVVKMIVEVAQLLSTAHHIHDSEFKDLVYKKTHVNHPCAIWARESDKNYMWLYSHFLALCQEYNLRYKKIHLTWRKLHNVLVHNPCPKGKFTNFVQAMPEQYKDEDVVKAYRNYYVGDKAKIAKWTYRTVPKWFKLDEE